MQLEIRLVKSRLETSSPLPMKTCSLCQRMEEKMAQVPSRRRGDGATKGRYEADLGKACAIL